MQSISAFLDIAKFADFWFKNADISKTQGDRHVIHISFGSPLVRHNCTKFHHCRICVTDFMEEGGGFAHPIREQPQKAHPE